MNDQAKEILEGAGPFRFPGNDIGIVLLHGGGGGTAADLKPLARDLHEKNGWTVNVPLLPGYGTTPEDLRETDPFEWKEAVEREWLNLRDACEKTFIGGHSMGGILTLIHAARHQVDGIFTISAPIGLKGFIHKLVPLFKFFMKYHPVDSERFRLETSGQWVGYDKIPINIALKMKKLMREMKEVLPQVTCPALLFQGEKDEVIKKKSMNFIYDAIQSEKKRKVWLEENDHAILNCPNHDQIVSEISSFIQEYANKRVDKI